MHSSGFSDPFRRGRIERHRQRVVSHTAPGGAAGRPVTVLGVVGRVAGIGGCLLLLIWTWSFLTAFLEEQRRAAQGPQPNLLDPHRASRALTPDNIEQWILSFSLELQSEGLQALSEEDAQPRLFAVGLGEPATYIAWRLGQEGFIANTALFNLYLRVNQLDRYLEAGNYMLSETMTIPEIAAALQQPSYEEVVVTLVEGTRMEEFAARLEENFVIGGEAFLDAVRTPQALTIFDDYDFLSDLPPGASLEGYLFPDTYRFPINADSAEIVIAKFLDNFDRRIGADGLRGNAGLTGRNLVTLASIVEREALLPDERVLIASVYVNRLEGLCRDEVRGPYLESDPTVQYPLGNAESGWWPPIQLADYQRVVSPYNTFLNPGLPPAPISNPGLLSLEAVRNPANTVYCFFHTTGIDGGHVFATTFAEHQTNIQRYGAAP